MRKLKKNKQDLKKDFFWNTLGSGINAFNSLFFMIIVTRINGVDDAGIFTFAFATANLFNIIGVYSGRVFQVTDSSDINDSDYFVNKIVTCVLMLLISIVFVLVRGYSLWKSSIILVLCLLKTFEAFVEVIYAFFQKNNYLYRVGFSLTLKNVLGLLVFLIVDIISKNVFLSALALVITYVLVMCLYDIKYLDKSSISLKKVIPKNVILIFKNGFFTFCLSFLTMYLLNIPRYVIDANMADSYSTIFGILIMPASVIVLITQFVLHPFLITIRDTFKSKRDKFVLIILRLVGFVSLIGVMAVGAAYLLGIPFLELIYGIDLEGYRSSLVIVMCGATLYGLVIMLSNILISMRIVFKQIIIYSISALVFLVLSNKLVIEDGVNGACVAYSITMLVTFICFIILMIISIYGLKKRSV